MSSNNSGYNKPCIYYASNFYKRFWGCNYQSTSSSIVAVAEQVNIEDTDS